MLVILSMLNFFSVLELLAFLRKFSLQVQVSFIGMTGAYTFNMIDDRDNLNLRMLLLKVCVVFFVFLNPCNF